MGGIDNNHIDTGFGQQRAALFSTLAHANRCTNAQTALSILGRQGVIGGFLHVLDRYQAVQITIILEHQYAFETMPVHQQTGIFKGGAFMNGDQLLTRGHDRGNRLIEIALEAQIAIRDDPHNTPAFHHGQARDLVLACQRDNFAHAERGRNRDRITQDA